VRCSHADGDLPMGSHKRNVRVRREKLCFCRRKKVVSASNIHCGLGGTRIVCKCVLAHSPNFFVTNMK
jgi:hypothetical protein